MRAGVNENLIFEKEHILSSDKVISRVYCYIDGVKIQKQTDWPVVYTFFFEYMDRLECFFWEYKEILEG